MLLCEMVLLTRRPLAQSSVILPFIAEETGARVIPFWSCAFKQARYSRPLTLTDVLEKIQEQGRRFISFYEARGTLVYNHFGRQLSNFLKN